MGMFVKGSAESKFYVDMEHGDVFEEGVDGLFVLNRIDGRKERVPVDEIQSEAQLLFGDAHRIWDYVR